MSYLREILDLRKADVMAEKSACDFATLESAALARRDRRDFRSALRRDPIAIIAEIKRASPSLGPITEQCDPATTAAQYAAGGAAALSVLTEGRHFKGHVRDLRTAKAAVTLPVLCKDFILDDFQVWNAAAHGADAILLITGALSDPELRSLLELCSRLSLAALVEVHTADEIQRAIAAGASLLGVNNRDLHTFAVDTETALRLRPRIPAQYTVVAESGYKTAAQIRSALAAGIDAVLIGEALMRAADAQATLRRLIADCARCNGEPTWSA